jgi:hypothetical protein
MTQNLSFLLGVMIDSRIPLSLKLDNNPTIYKIGKSDKKTYEGNKKVLGCLCYLGCLIEVS